MADSIGEFVGNFFAGDEESLTDEQKMERAKKKAGDKASRQAGKASRVGIKKKQTQARQVKAMQDVLQTNAESKKAMATQAESADKYNEYKTTMDQLSSLKDSRLTDPGVLRALKRVMPNMKEDDLINSVREWRKDRKYFGSMSSNTKVSEEDMVRANKKGMKPKDYQNRLLGTAQKQNIFGAIKQASIATGTINPNSKFGGVAAADAIQKKAAAVKEGQDAANAKAVEDKRRWEAEHKLAVREVEIEENKLNDGLFSKTNPYSIYTAHLKANPDDTQGAWAAMVKATGFAQAGYQELGQPLIPMTDKEIKTTLKRYKTKEEMLADTSRLGSKYDLTELYKSGETFYNKTNKKKTGLYGLPVSKKKQSVINKNKNKNLETADSGEDYLNQLDYGF